MKIQRIIAFIHSIFVVFLLKLKYNKKITLDFSTRIGKNSFFDIKGKVLIGRFLNSRNQLSVIVEKKGKCKIGNHVFFNTNCSITCLSEIEIESFCTFGNNVVIVDHDHDYLNYGKFKTGKVIIGEKTWIGANVTILRDTIIGRNCVIAAGCVVKGNIPDNTLLIQKRENIYKSL
jgi:acetyltransferase-like isoleucine patch superfamily enzyme